MDIPWSHRSRYEGWNERPLSIRLGRRGASPDILAQSTMATLSVDAGGATVTSVLDRGNRIYSNEVVVPLFSVAEWLVTNWWHIWYEVEDTGEQRPDFASRHNLAFAGEGFVLQSLTMTAASGRMQLRWMPYKPQHARIEFVDEGLESVACDELETELRNLIDAVIERLHGRPDTAPAADNLARVWNAVNGLDADELEFSHAAALLGLDPFDVQDDVADGIVAFWARTEPSLREDALATASDYAQLPRLAAVVRWRPPRSGGGRARQRLTDIRRAVPPPPLAIEPWTRGYTLARTTREWIGANGGRFDFSRRGRMAIPHQPSQPPSTRIHALVAAETPACITVPRGQSGTRFLIARRPRRLLGPAPGPACSALCPPTGKHNPAPSPPSSSHRQKPATATGGQRVEPERADDLAEEFGVSSQLIRHQVQESRPGDDVEY